MRKFLSRRWTHHEFTGTGVGWFYGIRKILHRSRTRFQKLELVETSSLGRALILDGITQFTEAQEFQYHEPMAHIPLLAHPDPRRILVIGGGDGALVREILHHPSVTSIDFVELDEGVVSFCRQYLPDFAGNAFDDPRVKLHIRDGRSYVQEATAAGTAWDIVFMDMTDPSGPSLPLYTREFFSLVLSLLANDDAFFVMHSESPECRPGVFARVQATLRSVFPSVRDAYTSVRMYGGLWSFAFCSRAADPAAVDVRTVAARISARKLPPFKLLSPDSWPAFFCRYPYIAQLLAADTLPATDACPGYE